MDTNVTLPVSDCSPQIVGCRFRLRLHRPRMISYLVWRYKWWQWLYQSPNDWCFRSTKDTTGKWKPFEMKNQSSIWEAAMVHKKECHLQDRSIDSGKQVVRVVIQEQVAYTMDPDWTEPEVYQVALCARVPARKRAAKWKDYFSREHHTYIGDGSGIVMAHDT